MALAASRAVIAPEELDPSEALDEAEEHAIVLEPMRRRHLGSVLAIEANALHRPWSLGTFLRELSHTTQRTYLVARCGGTIVGFAGVMYVAGEAHITTISVVPEMQGQRVGTRLMLALLLASIDHGMTSSSLEVRVENEAAIGLYRQFGYAPAGIRKGYYAEAGEDALIMWCHDLDTPKCRQRLMGVSVKLGLVGQELVRENAPDPDLDPDAEPNLAEFGQVDAVTGEMVEKGHDS